jgi:hypothetical protein
MFWQGCALYPLLLTTDIPSAHPQIYRKQITISSHFKPNRDFCRTRKGVNSRGKAIIYSEAIDFIKNKRTLVM